MTTWMDLEGIMLSEKSLIKKDKYTISVSGLKTNKQKIPPTVNMLIRTEKKLVVSRGMGCFPGNASDKEPTSQCKRLWEMWVRSLSWEDAPEVGMATHSSILAWRISMTEEPDGLQSMGLWRVGHGWSDLAIRHKRQGGVVWVKWVKEVWGTNFQL